MYSNSALSEKTETSSVQLAVGNTGSVSMSTLTLTDLNESSFATMGVGHGGMESTHFFKQRLFLF